MALKELTLHNVRTYRDAKLEPHPQLNIVVGRNASGKTTLLEAMWLLSHGKSFRTANTNQIRTHGEETFFVAGTFVNRKTGVVNSVSFREIDGQRQIHLDGQNAKAAELAQLAPSLAIEPDSHFLFGQSSKQRRAILDWSLFHVEQRFHPLWSKYQRTLQQRNACLRQDNQKRVAFAWEPELAILGDQLQAMRVEGVSELNSMFAPLCRKISSGAIEAELVLRSGWDTEAGLATCLAAERSEDIRRGFTRSGPHRNDLQILINGHQSTDEASHGQHKILTMAIRLAQAQLFVSRTGRECCFLVDDLAAELDREHLNRIGEVLTKMPLQVFLTTTDASSAEFSNWANHTVFHVKHGGIEIGKSVSL